LLSFVDFRDSIHEGNKEGKINADVQETSGKSSTGNILSLDVIK
jgi:hypothetical protein